MAARRTAQPKRSRHRELTVEGFKSIRDAQHIEVRPLTLMCGSNSSGKSAFMQPFLLLKQTLEVGFDPGPLLLQGPHVSFDNASEMFWSGRRRDDRADSIRIGIRDVDSEEVELTVVRTDRGVTISRLENRNRPPRADGKRPKNAVLTPELSPQQIKRLIDDDLYTSMARFGTLSVKRDRTFLDIVVRPDFANAPNTEDFALPIPSPSGSVLKSFATRLVHLPGLRDSPSRQYPVTKHGSTFPGPFPVYTASVIANWVETNDPRLSRVNESMKLLGLTWKVVAERLDDTKVRVRVGRLPQAQHGGARDLVNVADVGLGVSQALPIVVALQAASTNQVVYLEQPELHLHPRAQLGLGQVLINAAVRGVRIICETHSNLLLRSLQTAVAQSPDLAQFIALNWFVRESDGATRIEKAEFDSHGRFGEWPVDFGDIEVEAEMSFLEASLGMME